ncbi:hypothetical protein ACFQDE_05050 [Deinococcus caeni]|uniref:hypothetical protein n=1 Tax=Deinococcus caeni TaxID=569127 RepID=UPI00361574AA
MLDELSIQITKPQVWIGLALTALFAYAIYRFGRLLIKALTPTSTADSRRSSSGRGC